jgi:hypothetical protein
MDYAVSAQALTRIGGNHIVGIDLKFTHNWERRDQVSLAVENPLLALKFGRYLRNWGPPIETIMQQPDVELPDVDELNSQIPIEQWSLGLDGQPRKPWAKYWLVYLLDVRDATLFNFANMTVGTRTAIVALEDRCAWMSALQGTAVMPLVKLSARPFHTQYGERRAPDFTIIGWRMFRDGVLRIVDHTASNLQTVEPLSVEAGLKDAIPF